MKTYKVIDVPQSNPCENCTPCMRLKLMEMGFIPGEDVLLEITAPLGDPLSIMIAGYNLSIRKSEAENIWVKPIQ